MKVNFHNKIKLISYIIINKVYTLDLYNLCLFMLTKDEYL